VIVVPLGYVWWGSRVPSTYNVMDMGYVDVGGGSPVPMTGGTPVSDLTGPATGAPAVTVTLVARRQSFRLASGEQVDGYTLNGRSPGPVIRATQGDLVQITLVNRDVGDGVTLHWHGIDVPNAEDGVAGVTQDAVRQGGRHVYRFVVPDAGTYWYHSHQVSHEQVKGGLFGTFVVQPRDAAPAHELVAPVHTYDGRRTLAGRTGDRRLVTAPGQNARIRLVNTNDGPLVTWVAGSSYRVLAVDGHDVNAPSEIRGKAVVIPAGGRADLEITAPTDGRAARVDVGSAAVLVGPAGARRAETPVPDGRVDLLHYGSPTALPFDPAHPDRRFEYRIGRRIGFENGLPGFWWSINGHLWPDVPMHVIREGDIVTMSISNTSGDVHPMHLHGHHAVVLSRNGVKATGSPWWVDTLEVDSGDTYVIAFAADNPGIWMDHCHNLKHATQGLVAHLAYAGVTEPFTVGAGRQDVHNHPE
jgi:FtsP/CotA-like multicopper oxidase with cupredoxin domain